MNDCAQPGLTASTYSMVAANALSTLVNVICLYRIDGRAVLTPVGLQMTPAEPWKAEASRTAFTTSDDCDGSAAHVTSALADARIVALDPELAEKFPVTARVANALSMHFVGVCCSRPMRGTRRGRQEGRGQHCRSCDRHGASTLPGLDSLLTGAFGRKTAPPTPARRS